MHNKSLSKVIVISLIIGIILILVGLVIGGGNADAPVTEFQNATSTTESLKLINDESGVRNDMDAYINATDSVPNPNDFNDSYSDLNQ